MEIPKKSQEQFLGETSGGIAGETFAKFPRIPRNISAGIIGEVLEKF